MGLKQELRQKAYLLVEKCSRNIIYSMLIKNQNGEVFGALSNNILNIKFRSYTTGEIKLVRFELKNGAALVLRLSTPKRDFFAIRPEENLARFGFLN